MGRRWGKTVMAGTLCVAVANAGGAVAWVVPVYKNARAPWRFVKQAVGRELKHVHVLESDRIVEFPSGGRLTVYSAENDVGIRSESFDLVVVDEAARVKEDTFAEVLMPTIADTDGRMLLISTPKGRNWFWREWMRGQQNDGQSASWTAPSTANPMPAIQRAAEMARERTSERSFRQEWLAEFVEDGGGVIRYVRQAVAAMPLGPAAEGAYVAGVDWALTTDKTVCTVVDVVTGKTVAVDAYNSIDYAMQRERIAALCRAWQVGVVIAEANAMGKPNNDELRRMGVPVRDFTTTNATKADIIESLASAFENHRIQIPNNPVLIGELEALEATRTASGMVRYAAPDGMHDDHVISLALAWSAAQRRPLLL